MSNNIAKRPSDKVSVSVPRLSKAQYNVEKRAARKDTVRKGLTSEGAIAMGRREGLSTQRSNPPGGGAPNLSPTAVVVGWRHL